MKTVYVADFKYKYGRPNLARVEIAKETPRTITVANSTNLIGRQYFGKRTPRAGINIFPNKRDAALYLLEKAKVYAEQCRKAVVKADEVVVEMLALALDE